MDNKLKQAYARMYSTWTSEDHARAADLSKDPEYIKYHREQAKAKSTQKESRMNTPLINATLRYLDEQMLDEAKKSPWTVKKHQGDDEYSYALFKDGKPAMTGLGKREAKYHLEKAKAGHYDRKLDEEVEALDEMANVKGPGAAHKAKITKNQISKLPKLTTGKHADDEKPTWSDRKAGLKILAKDVLKAFRKLAQ